MGYLRQILTSAVYDVAVETPLDPAPRLSEATGNRVLLKREDMQPVFSFKLRGAYNKIASLTQASGRWGTGAGGDGRAALMASMGSLCACRAVSNPWQDRRRTYMCGMRARSLAARSCRPCRLSVCRHRKGVIVTKLDGDVKQSLHSPRRSWRAASSAARRATTRRGLRLRHPSVVGVPSSACPRPRRRSKSAP